MFGAKDGGGLKVAEQEELQNFNERPRRNCERRQNLIPATQEHINRNWVTLSMKF